VTKVEERRPLRILCDLCYYSMVRARSCIDAHEYQKHRPEARRQAEQEGNSGFLESCGLDCEEARRLI